MLPQEADRIPVDLVDAGLWPVRTDDRLERPVHYPISGVQLRGPLREPLHSQDRVLTDEPPHVLGLVARGVVHEEDDLLHIVPLRIGDEVGEVGA